MSIADELVLLANTKENLRVCLGLSKDVPFSQYASRLPFYAKSGTVFDFVKNQYSKDQLPVDLSDISEFIRLSSATEWQNGKLVEVADNVPRISGGGLLIEPQSTNTLTRNLDKFQKRNSTITPLEDGMFELKALSTESPRQTGLALYPSVPFNDGQLYSISLVAEAGTYKDVRLGVFHARYANQNVAYNLSEGTYGSRDIASPQVVMNKVGEDKYVIGFQSNSQPEFSDFNIFLTNYTLGSDTGHLGIFDGTEFLSVGYPQIEPDNIVTSYIPIGGTPATRAPDILNIPLLPTQTITGDWDEGITYEIVDNEAVFTGHGYIRNITVEAL